MGYNLHAEAGIKSKCIRGIFAEERLVWALSISLVSRPGMLQSKFISALWKVTCWSKSQCQAVFWYMTAGRNFLLKSVFQRQALPRLVEKGGRKGKGSGDMQISDGRGRRSKGGSHGENAMTSKWLLEAVLPVSEMSSVRSHFLTGRNSPYWLWWVYTQFKAMFPNRIFAFISWNTGLAQTKAEAL